MSYRRHDIHCVTIVYCTYGIGLSLELVSLVGHLNAVALKVGLLALQLLQLE